MRLFEIGTRFRREASGAAREQRVVAGVACGARWPEQWGGGREPVDFYDVKADVAALLQMLGAARR